MGRAACHCRCSFSRSISKIGACGKWLDPRSARIGGGARVGAARRPPATGACAAERSGLPVRGTRQEEVRPMLIAIYQVLQLILGAAFFIMIVHIIMSWLINFNVLNVRQEFVGAIWTGLNRLLEPVYQPIREILPDTRPLDLAPLVAFLIVIALRDIILPTAFGLR
jgi:YggT family protein